MGRQWIGHREPLRDLGALGQTSHRNSARLLSGRCETLAHVSNIVAGRLFILSSGT